MLTRGEWDQPAKWSSRTRRSRSIRSRRTGRAIASASRNGWPIPDSPLTARVAVNHIWQAIFGTGLVETAEDFGTRAPVPEYRDLLDWLAVDFMEHGWSRNT